MHLDEPDLRAYLDGELPPAESQRAAAHLAECAACREQLEPIQARASRVSAAMNALAPQGGSEALAPSSIDTARAAKAAWRQLEPTLQEKTPMSNWFARLRPLWATLTVVALLAVALSFPSVQALASNFLRLFRAQQVTVLPLDMTSLKDMRYDATLGQSLNQILSDSVKVTRPAGKEYDAAGAKEASQGAGFTVRLSKSGQLPLSRLTVQPGMSFEGTFDQALAAEVLQALGKNDLQIPAGLNGAVVKVEIPDGITAAYGSCKYSKNADGSVSGGPALGLAESCLLLVELPSPTVDTPPDLPVTRLAELGLQALGMAPDKAAQLARQIDWTTTLVIPIPKGEMDSRAVTVDGVEGQLLSQRAGATTLVPSYTLVWVKNGIVYAVLGTGDPAKGIQLANSLE